MHGLGGAGPGSGTLSTPHRVTVISVRIFKIQIVVVTVAVAQDLSQLKFFTHMMQFTRGRPTLLHMKAIPTIR